MQFDIPIKAPLCGWLRCMWRDNPAYNPLAVTKAKTKSSTEQVQELLAILHGKTKQGSPPHDEDDKNEEDDDTGGMGES